MLDNYFETLRTYEIKVNFHSINDFYNGLAKGLVANLDDLYLYSKLCFVKKKEQIDNFDRCFAFYFYDIDLPNVSEGNYDLLQTKQFQQWLQKAWANKELEHHPNFMPVEELMKKFWQTVKEQAEAHHGGNKWVGTGGTSPFGHSGAAQRGVRVHGDSKNFSAIKVIGQRKHINYSGANSVKQSNIKQAIDLLKHLKPGGGHTELDLSETIYQTAKNGGEFELIFKRQLLDKLNIILLIDNGGSSMRQHADKTFYLFSQMKNRFKKFTVYFFHNTIYSYIFKDQQRTQPISIFKLLQAEHDTRIFIMGDASMSPEELFSNYGNINYGEEEHEASIEWLKKINDRFKNLVWLNPIPKENWGHSYGYQTIHKISSIINMNDMTLNGIKKSVDYMNNH